MENMLSLNTNELSGLKSLVDSRQPGYGLPRRFYHDELLYQAEMEAIWRQGWLFAGHSCKIPNIFSCNRKGAAAIWITIYSLSV